MTQAATAARSITLDSPAELALMAELVTTFSYDELADRLTAFPNTAVALNVEQYNIAAAAVINKLKGAGALDDNFTPIAIAA